MILPFINNTLDVFKHSGTWLLVVINTFVFFVVCQDQVTYDQTMSRLMEDKIFKQAAVQQYAEYIKSKPEQYGGLHRLLATQVLGAKYSNSDLLLSLSLRDPEFYWDSKAFAKLNDHVLSRAWENGYQQVIDTMPTSPGFRFGISSMTHNFGRFLSYQFVHGGGLHLFTNMIFLIVFGINLEMLIGGALLMLTYLISGAAGAIAYVYISGLSLAPLVGASAAVYGVMAAYVVMYWRMPVRFVILLLPRQFFYFPAWSILAVLATIDIFGQLSYFHGLAGVAHAAHLGGAIAGIAIGLFFRSVPAFRNARVQFNGQSEVKPSTSVAA